MPDVVYCPKHPDTQTNLRCGRCDKPVCPRCMVHTPVGVRCQECAQLRKLPTFEVSWPFFVRALVASLVVGVCGGMVFVFFLRGIFGRMLFLDVIILAGLGYLVGEGVSWVTNRKRGRILQYVAAGGVVASFVTITVFLGVLDLYYLLGSAIGIAIAVARMR